MTVNVATVLDDTIVPIGYAGIVARIKAALPAIERDSANFGKSHSQFMVSTLDVAQLTTIRAIKHTLAEIDRTKAALSEAYIKQRRRAVDRREIQSKLDSASSGFDRERLEIDVLEADFHAAATGLAVQGALRKLSHLVAQYDSLMSKHGKQLSEADYEADEARYHVMTVLKQALCAARSRGGIIDEGNFIYLFDMGLPSAEVQAQIMAYLDEEQRLIKQGKSPTHEMTMRWLEACADRWQHCAHDNAVRRGMLLCDPMSLHESQGVDDAA